MSKWANDTVFLDRPLDYVSASVDLMVACSSSPTTFTQAASTYRLAQVSMTSADFTKSDGDTNGRKIRSASKSASVLTTGCATHVAYLNSPGSVLVYITTCTEQALTASNVVNFPAWDIEIADPA